MSAAASGVLSVVGTPIGNLSDASPRVIQTLKSADLLLCEDTRVTSKLLARFDVHVPLQRADENVLDQRVEPTLERIEAGDRVEVIPGPSAAICALVASGLPMEHFFFEGFLPRKAGAMRARLEELSVVPGALVVYESPHRVATTLARIAEVLPDREVALVRELTKVHEECLRGRAPELAALVAERDEVKGECVVVIGAPTEEELLGRRDAASQGTQSLEEAIRAGLEEGEPKTKLAKRLAKSFSLAKAEVYDAILRESER